MAPVLAPEIHRQYNLGNVKEWVSTAAEYLGKKHKVKSIGGYRAQGSVKNSDHPKGLAIDLMTSSKSQGDAIANDAIANAKALGITYVIWYRKIWKASTGRWENYSGPSPHTDHVHVSFSDKGGSGTTDLVGGGSSATADPNCAWKISVAFGETCLATNVQVRQVFSIGVGAAGALVFVVGLFFLLRIDNQVARVATRVIPIPVGGK